MFEAQIERGVEYLDQDLGPSWVEDIELDELELWSGCNCVVGQLYGEFWKQFDSLWKAQGYAFSLPETMDYMRGNEREYLYADLTQEWRAKIAQLRAERSI